MYFLHDKLPTFGLSFSTSLIFLWRQGFCELTISNKLHEICSGVKLSRFRPLQLIRQLWLKCFFSEKGVRGKYPNLPPPPLCSCYLHLIFINIIPTLLTVIDTATETSDQYWKELIFHLLFLQIKTQRIPCDPGSHWFIKLCSHCTISDLQHLIKSGFANHLGTLYQCSLNNQQNSLLFQLSSFTV